MSTRTFTKGTYQMLWDCERCDSVGLLGVDHRYCPNCGAPQQAERRYFPTKAQRVATAYVGNEPDWTCERCSTPNASPFCVSCGAPRGASADVEVQAPRALGTDGELLDDASTTPGDGGPSSERTERSSDRRRTRRQREEARQEERAASKGPQTWEQRRRWVIARIRNPSRALVGRSVGIAALLIVLLVVVLTWTRGITMEVESRTWSRTTALQEWRAVAESEWCSSMPAGAYGVTSTTKLHHYDQVPDGEDCHTEPGGCSQSCSAVDNGNGSFSEVCTETCTPDRQVCTTRYRQVPVYAEHCSYTIDRWVELRRETARGALPSEPRWPSLATRTCDEGNPSFGCERDAYVESQYDVALKGTSAGVRGRSTTCTVKEETWLQMAEGSTWQVRQRIVTGWIDCRTLHRGGRQSS
jgi:hypothetical protein